MKRKSIGTNYSMCVQPTFIIGTYNEDDSPNFAPITWVSATCEGDEYLFVVSMFGTKKIKQNVVREKFNPIIYSGQYHSLGKHLGKIGDFICADK